MVEITARAYSLSGTLTTLLFIEFLSNEGVTWPAPDGVFYPVYHEGVLELGRNYELDIPTLTPRQGGIWATNARLIAA